MLYILQADIAEHLYRLSINSRTDCSSCIDFRDRVARDQRNILVAMREQRFSMNPQPAPPTVELPRPEIPRDRPSKRRGGYLSTQPSSENENVVRQEPHNLSQPHYTSPPATSTFSSPTPSHFVPQYMSSSFASSYSGSLYPSNFPSFTSLLNNPNIFSSQHHVSTHEHGGPSNEQVTPPRQSVSLVDSPWFDLNATSQTNDTVQPDEEVNVQQRPLRMRRGTRCGTGSHYLSG